MARKGRKAKRRLIIISLTVIALLFSLVSNLYHDFSQIINNKKQIAVLTKEYNKLEDDQKKLSSEVAKMQDPNYIARYAKEKYLYSQDGEIIIRTE